MTNEDRILNQIKDKLGEEGLRYFYQYQEIPPLQLTNEEMVYLQGGGIKRLWNKIVEWVNARVDRKAPGFRHVPRG